MTKFESDMTSAIYNAISKVCFNWRDSGLSDEQIITAVDRAVDWWSDRFFEECDEE